MLSIIIFFAIMFFFGYSVTFFIKRDDDVFERFFMSVAVGIAFFVVLSALLAVLKIPLVWPLFFVLSLVAPAYLLVSKKLSFKFSFSLKKSHFFFFIVFALFLFSLFMYHKGAFSYALFEDGDPWRHSGIAKYIAVTKTALEPWQGADILQYVDSYPPGFDVLLSVMYQVSGELVWSVKFFNLLIISLGIIFFYFFAKHFTKSAETALVATVILALIPCYMSHFVWALSLAMALIYPLFYSLERIRENKLWGVPSAVCYAGVLLSQPTHAAKISVVLVIYLVLRMVFDKKILWKELSAVVAGGLSSIGVWWVPMYLKYGSIKALVLGAGTSASVLKGAEGFSLKFHGTADRVYAFSDFFYAKSVNMINNPVGVGVVLMLVLFFTLVYAVIKYKDFLSRENQWVVISACWLLFAFLGIHGERLPIQFWAFRFWMFFAVFFSLFSSFGFVKILALCKKFGIPAFVVSALLIAGIWFTSGVQKWDVNTVSWENTAGEFVQYNNLDSWKWVSQLPQNTKVFFPCRNQKNMDVAVLGVDKYSCLWCRDEKDFKMSFVNATSGSGVVDFARQKGYDYLFIDGNCFGSFGDNLTVFNEFLVNISSSAPLVQKSGGGFVWEI
jgi:hypothetical protein